MQEGRRKQCEIICWRKDRISWQWNKKDPRLLFKSFDFCSKLCPSSQPASLGSSGSALLPMLCLILAPWTILTVLTFPHSPPSSQALWTCHFYSLCILIRVSLSGPKGFKQPGKPMCRHWVGFSCSLLCVSTFKKLVLESSVSPVAWCRMHRSAKSTPRPPWMKVLKECNCSWEVVKPLPLGFTVLFVDIRGLFSFSKKAFWTASNL